MTENIQTGFAEAPTESVSVEPQVDTVVVVVEPEPVIDAMPDVEAPAISPDANRGDVLWIQQRLQELGYYQGPVDGNAGNATRAAIQGYQRDQGIVADGQPTAELREFMWRNGG